MERSLYERLGGIDAITAVAHTPSKIVPQKDDRINQKFARTNLDRLTKSSSTSYARTPAGRAPTPGSA